MSDDTTEALIRAQIATWLAQWQGPIAPPLSHAHSKFILRRLDEARAEITRLREENAQQDVEIMQRGAEIARLRAPLPADAMEAARAIFAKMTRAGEDGPTLVEQIARAITVRADEPALWDLACTLRQALAEAHQSTDYWMQAQAETSAERDALRRKLDAAMKVVAAARLIETANSARGHWSMALVELRKALAALEADPT